MDDSKIRKTTNLEKKKLLPPLMTTLIIAMLIIPLYGVLGQVGVAITSVVPPAQAGKVGDPVRVVGWIDTPKGEYKIWFGTNLMVSNISIGNKVDATFSVPQLPGGKYTLTLEDVSKKLNATKDFTLNSGYYIKALSPSPPAQFQEGSNVGINITLSGVQANKNYFANVTIKLPNPLNTNFSRIVEIGVSNEKGFLSTSLTYPSSAFNPTGSLTDYCGVYNIYFNQTQMLATNQFLIGFTDKTEYHRDQTLKIKAIAYQPNENVTVNIAYKETGVNIHNAIITASPEGIVNSTWKIPTKALIGDYNLTITPRSTRKPISDSAVFTIPGYEVKIKAVDLAAHAVAKIGIEAFDRATNMTYNATSKDDGVASIKLERGPHSVKAFWNGVYVGEKEIAINGEETFDLNCKLANLQVIVQDEDGTSMPFVEIEVTYQYVTTKDSSQKTGFVSGQTNLSGSFLVNSTLPEISYIVNASMYGLVFNIGNNTVERLNVQAFSEVRILCPSLTLALEIVDYNRLPIPNVKIEIVEITNGLFYSIETDNIGNAEINSTFGRYKLRVRTDSVLLNETILDVFFDLKKQIRCSLYNIQLSIIVVDYFNHPITDVAVILGGPGIEKRTIITESDGTATFENLIGGTIQITAYPSGKENIYEALELQIEEPQIIRVKMDKYVSLGLLLIETSSLAAFIIVFLAATFFVAIEVWKKRK